jgi:hypothetical protein
MYKGASRYAQNRYAVNLRKDIAHKHAADDTEYKFHCSHCKSSKGKKSKAKPPHKFRWDCLDCNKWVKWSS